MWRATATLEGVNAEPSLNLDYGGWVTVEATRQDAGGWGWMKMASFDLATGERLGFPEAEFSTDGSLILTEGTSGGSVVYDRSGAELYRIPGEPAVFSCSFGVTDALPGYELRQGTWDFVARSGPTAPSCGPSRVG